MGFFGPLGACGRKGPLDPPPGASIEGVAQPVAPRLMRGTQTPQPIEQDTGVDENGQPRAPKGPNKRIPLDNLLN